MDKRTAFKFLLFFVFTGLFGFIGAYTYDQQRLLRQMSVGFDYSKYAKIKSLSFTNIVLELYLKFVNLSLVDINIDGYDLAIYINGKLIIPHVYAANPGYIKAQGESIVPLTVQFNPIAALGNLFSSQVMNAALFDYSKVIVRVVGYVSANHRGVEIKDIKVDISDNLQNLLYGGAKQTT